MTPPGCKESLCYQLPLPHLEIPNWKEYKKHGDIFGSIEDIDDKEFLVHRFSRLRLGLADLLLGQSLGKWVERKTTRLLEQFGHLHAPPVRLEQDKDLLRALKISEIRFKIGFPERGSLSIQEDGFLVTLDPTLFPPFGFRATLAHEIAHTFFFYCDGGHPPKDLSHFPAGDEDLEWLCSYIARNILIPTSLFRKKAALYRRLESNKFSIKVLFDLADKFEVPWPTIGIKLAEDLPLEFELYKT